MHFLTIDVKGISVNGVAPAIIFVTLIVNQKVIQIYQFINLDVESGFKILDWSSHTAKVYLNRINALFFYETGKMLVYQQMYFLTIDLKSNGVELLITFVTLIVNKKVIPCLCHFICLELFQIVMRLEICWLGHHIKYWLVNHINKCFFIDRLTST